MSNSSGRVLDGCQGTCVFTFAVAGNTVGSSLQTTAYIVLSSTYYITNLQCPIMCYMGVPLKLHYTTA